MRLLGLLSLKMLIVRLGAGYSYCTVELACYWERMCSTWTTVKPVKVNHFHLSRFR